MPAPPAIAIVIDDLGNSLDDGEEILALPAPVALAVLPGTAHAGALARRALAAGREVLLHQPMSALPPAPDAGPLALQPGMGLQEISARLQVNLADVPGALGLNSHMGSAMTTDVAAMDMLMQLLRARGGLFFIDSYTHPASIALDRARSHGLPSARRDVFLDHETAAEAVGFQLGRLCRVARRRGTALAIGHPREVTLALLASALPQLWANGFELVTLRELIARRERPREGPRPGPVMSSTPTLELKHNLLMLAPTQLPGATGGGASASTSAGWVP